MTKIYFVFALLIGSLAARAQFPAPYCAEDFNSNVEPITKVVFAGISNASTATLGSTAHEDFTAITGSVQQGGSYIIQVGGNTDGNYDDYIRLFIDWNSDGDFTDVGEAYNVGILTNSTGLDNILVSTAIAIPGTATLGSKRMRVSKRWNAYANPCNIAGYGQAEDYTLTVTAGSACTGTPSGGSINPASSTICSGSSVTLTSVSTNLGTGLTYQWQSSPAGANTFTNITGATANTYAASPTTSTTYRLIITCGGTTASATSSTATITISAVPVNDLVCNAVSLTLNGASNCQNTLCATATGDPAFGSSTPNNTVWYRYTPAASGPVAVKFKRPSGVTTGLLYGWLGTYTATGTCPSLNLTEISGTAVSFDLTMSDSVLVATTNLTAGTTYYFMIDGFSGASGAFCIQLETAPPPPPCTTNISPANAATGVTYLPFIQFSWNAVAGASSYDFYWSTNGGTSYTNLGTISDTSVSLSATSPNTTYYWYVAPRNLLAASGCQANATRFTTGAVPPPPANDSCGAPVALNPYGGPINGTTVSATTSMPSALCTGFTSARALDVWYSVVAMVNGPFTVTVTGTSGAFDPVVAIYHGTCSALIRDTCSDNSGMTETLTFSNAVAGTTYRIRVYGYGSSTDSIGTFTILASGPALPVTGMTLTAARSSKNVRLGWQTLTEMNNAGFEIQRSADGSRFTSFLQVASKALNGNSTSAINYSADDVKPFNGANYYRLKQTDKDGKISYSNVVYVKGLAVNSLTLSTVYPNPTKDVLKASVQSPAAEKVTFVITDMAGKMISRQTATITTGDNTVNLNVANLPSGSYLLKAVCNNGCETAVQKFTKQ